MVAETTMPRFCFIHYIIYVDHIMYLFTDETCPCDSLSPWVRFTQNSMKKLRLPLRRRRKFTFRKRQFLAYVLS